MDDLYSEKSDDTLELYPYRVLNLATGKWLEKEIYAATAVEAIIIAWANANKDTNVFEWAEKYGPLVEQGKISVLIGDLCTLMSLKELQPEGGSRELEQM